MFLDSLLWNGVALFMRTMESMEIAGSGRKGWNIADYENMRTFLAFNQKN